MEVYWLMMVIQVTSSSHVVHVGNFQMRAACEQAARDVTRPAVIGAPADHAAFYCVRAFDQNVLTPPPPRG
jgi:hypothetical protein